MSGTPFFLRLDDISDLDVRLVYLMEHTLGLGIPVLATVIPAQLAPETAECLLRLHNPGDHHLTAGDNNYW